MKKWLATVFCLVCLQVPAYGADPPSGSAPSSSTANSSEPKSSSSSASKSFNETRGYADKWALVVGVNSFPDQKGQLKYGEHDAQIFRDFLVNEVNFADSHVMLLQGKDATAKNIRQAVEALKKVCQKDDLLVVYLRTPGIYASHIESAYFAACDTSMADLRATAFEMVEFPLSLAKSFKVADVALILDSDFSGKALRLNSQVDYNAVREKEKEKRLYIFTSTGESEKSAESEAAKGGVFTGLLIEKLKEDRLARLSKSVSGTRLGCSNCSAGEVMLSTPSYLSRKFNPPTAKGAASDVAPKGAASDVAAPKGAN